MNPLPIPARSLHRRKVRIGDDVFDDVSLFPFFNQAGQVKHVLVLRDDTSQICLMRWRPGDFAVPLWSAVKVTGESAWLPPLSEDGLEELAGLWHYDPWWVLNARRYRKLWAVDELKATNCVHKLTVDVKTLWFRRDLSRSNWVEVRSHSEYNLQRWKARLLPDPPASADHRGRQGAATWRFDPVWARWTAQRRGGPVHQNARL